MAVSSTVRLAMIGAAFGVGAALLKRATGRARPTCAYPGPRPRSHGPPFYQGDPCPVWPVRTEHSRDGEVAFENGGFHGNMSRRFSACRDGCSRHHAGVDLYARAGDIVQAAEAGIVVRNQSFAGGLRAVLIGSQWGTLLYGEVDDVLVKVGDRVSKGQPIARVGLWPSGSHMLHFESYSIGTTQNRRWHKKAPAELLDPTDFLLRAQASLSKVA